MEVSSNLAISMKISEEHEELVSSVRQFLATRIKPEYIREVDLAHRFPEEAWAEISTLGWLGWPIAEEYGGLGGDLTGTTLIVEELCRGFFALGNAYVNSTYAASYSIGLYGSDDLKRDYLPRLAEGKIRFAFGFTEPGGGQDVLGAIRTRAEHRDGRWVLNGQKVFTTHANVSDYIVVLAKTDNEARRSDGLSIFLVDRRAPGVEVNVLDTIVFWANETCEVFFSDVELPDEAVVGKVGAAWRQMTRTLDVEKIVVAAEAIGNAQAALDYAIQYALERQSFGGPIGRFQALQHYVAEAAIKIHSARLLIYSAAAKYDAGLPHSIDALMAKVAASEAGVFTTDVGMRIMGGYGYMTEYPMQRYFRDSRVFLTGPVTNEMGKNQIAERLGMPRSY